ncbi:lysophospholipid acyltransferase family protein [Algibacter sp. R77976]|uniref:lysophospholipid acyltransferase family protein n=1 Tax=Algibacter sp. R77976 TaxID=3093873 RepID=UPI0037C9F7D3
MKRIWLSFVRGYIGLGMFFYFRRIHVNNIENVPKNKPVLVLSNHQNALLDALLIAIKCGRFSYFLTRAGVFNKPFVAKILKSLQMLPVYRIRDGWGNLANNNAIFATCSKLLNNNACIVIFPEGNHSLKRTVRPLSKGFTRIIMETFEENPALDLQLLPVGLNFKHADKFPDSTSIYFGKPIAANTYVSENKNESVIKLKTKIQSEIAELTTHIPKDNYDSDLNRLHSLDVDFLKPKAVNNCLNSGFEDCESKKPDSNFRFFKNVFKILLIIAFILPVLVWKYVAKPKIKEIEFLSTFRFAVVVTLAPLWLIVVFATITFTLGWQLAFGYFIASLCIALLAVKL